MICDICTQNCDEYTHLALYVNGSEGITVCLECRIALTDHVKHLKSIANRTRLLLLKDKLHKGEI